MTTATKNMTRNVTMCRRSDTAKLRYGGMKKKSKATTLRTAVRRDGTYPNRIDMTTTPRRYTITTSGKRSCPKPYQPSAVEAPAIATAAAAPVHGRGGGVSVSAGGLADCPLGVPEIT